MALRLVKPEGLPVAADGLEFRATVGFRMRDGQRREVVSYRVLGDAWMPELYHRDFIIAERTTGRPPGNVRELRNAIERAMILEESALLTTSSLPVTINHPLGAGDGTPTRLSYQIPDEGISLEENERTLVARALEKTGGNQTQAARLLRITRDTLRYKMKKFHLK